MICPCCGYENKNFAVACANCSCNMVAWMGGQPTFAADTGDENATIWPQDRLWLSILLSIFGFQVFGVVAVVYSVITRVEKDRGNYDYAAAAARAVDKWNTWAFLGGIVEWTIVLSYAFDVFSMFRY